MIMGAGRGGPRGAATTHAAIVAAFFVIATCAPSSGQSLQSGAVFRDCPQCPQMVVIPAGEFMMGASDEETARYYADVPDDGDSIAAMLGVGYKKQASKSMYFEHPKHKVNISKSFALGIFPVTVREFGAFVHETRYRTGRCVRPSPRRGLNPDPNVWMYPGFPQSDDNPVVCITWSDAKAYVAWLNKRIGQNEKDGPYRLPTEAEWEYAARAGTTTARWWGEEIGVGNDLCKGCGVSPGNPRAHGAIRSGPLPGGGIGWIGTAPVTLFRPNPFGLFNMLGNVTQPTEDCWHRDYIGAPGDGSADLKGECTRRVERGASWNYPSWFSRASRRGGETVDSADNESGIRVAKTLR